MVSVLVLIIGIFLMGMLMLFLIRIQRGLLGLLLAGVATILMIYWMREIKQIAKQEFKISKTMKKTWNYDIIETDSTVTIIAEVPGPVEDVKVAHKNKSISITGGAKFKKKVSIPRNLSLIGTSYLNGTLTINLQRLNNISENNPKRDSISFKDN
jgi:HSP20 family molecular chaperone IbpA